MNKYLTNWPLTGLGMGLFLISLGPIFFALQTDRLAIGLVGILIGFVLIMWSARQHLWRGGWWWPVFGLVLTIPTLFLTATRMLAVETLIWWWLGLGAAWLAAGWITENRLKSALVWLVIVITAAAVAGLVMWAMNNGRAGGWQYNANGFGGLMLWGWFAAGALLLLHKRKWWAWTAWGMIFAALLLSLSLTAWVAAVVTIGLGWLVVSRKLPPKKILIALAIAMLLGGGYLTWASAQGKKLLSVEFSFSQRIEFIKTAAAEWRAKPVFGWGAGAYQIVFPRYSASTAEQTRHAHNQYLQILAEHGAVGLAAWLALVGLIGWSGWRVIRQAPDRSERTAALGLTGAWLAFTVHIGLDFSWYFPAGQMWWWLVSGLLVGANFRARSKPSPIFVRVVVGVAGLLVVTAAGIFLVNYRQAYYAAIHSQRGEYDQAIDNYRSVLALTPWRSDAIDYANCLLFRRRGDDLDRGAEFLNAQLRTNRDDYQLQYLLGRFHLAADRYQPAVVAFRRALELDPTFHPVFVHDYALTLERVGDRAVAIEALTEYIDRMTDQKKPRTPNFQKDYRRVEDLLKRLRASSSA